MQKLIVSYRVKQCLIIYGIRTFITLFTSSCTIWCVLAISSFFKMQINVIVPSMSRYHKCFFLSDSSVNYIKEFFIFVSFRNMRNFWSERYLTFSPTPKFEAHHLSVVRYRYWTYFQLPFLPGGHLLHIKPNFKYI